MVSFISRHALAATVQGLVANLTSGPRLGQTRSDSIFPSKHVFLAATILCQSPRISLPSMLASIDMFV